MAKDIRIGLLHVIKMSQHVKILGDSAGAWITALCYSLNEHDFVEKVSVKLSLLGLIIVEFEDIELLSKRLEIYTVDKEFMLESENLNDDNNVVFGKFHCYPLDDLS